MLRIVLRNGRSATVSYRTAWLQAAVTPGGVVVADIGQGRLVTFTEAELADLAADL